MAAATAAVAAYTAQVSAAYGAIAARVAAASDLRELRAVAAAQRELVVATQNRASADLLAVTGIDEPPAAYAAWIAAEHSLLRATYDRLQAFSIALPLDPDASAALAAFQAELRDDSYANLREEMTTPQLRELGLSPVGEQASGRSAQNTSVVPAVTEPDVIPGVIPDTRKRVLANNSSINSGIVSFADDAAD
jgi:hypothetical protein